MTESDEDACELEGANDSLTQNLNDQFLSCKICLDRFKDPKSLPCLHTFCATCLHYYIEHNHIEARKFACPICRRQVYIPRNGVDGFPDSFFVTTLADMVQQRQREKWCGICKFQDKKEEGKVLCVDCNIELCEHCSTAHSSAKITATHTLIPTTERQQPGLNCRLHKGEIIKYYCETCNVPVCLPCTFLTHQGHQIEEIKNVRDTFAMDMKDLMVKSKDNILQLTQTKADLTELENELFIRKEAIKTDIRRAAQSILRKLHEQEAILMNELDAIYDIASISRDRQKLDRTRYLLERSHQFADELLSSSASPIAQLVNRTEAKENLLQALDYQLPDLLHHTERLNRFCHFLPGQLDLHVGSLLTSTGQNRTNTSTLRHTMPSSKAVYLNTLRTPEEGSNLGQPISLAFLQSGEIVALMSEEKHVKIFNTKGNLTFEFGSSEDLQHPSDLVTTRDGLIVITDCGDFTVKKFDIFGAKHSSFGGPETFQLPIAIATDSVGHFLVCDQVKQAVTIHRESGELVKSIEISEVSMPQDIACYGNKVYIADCQNRIITFYNYDNEGLGFLLKLDLNHSEETTQISPTNDTELNEITEDSDTENEENAVCTAEQPTNTVQLNTPMADCTSIKCDLYGNLIVADQVLNRLHMLNAKGETSVIVTKGRPMNRPTCIATSNDGLIAVSHEGVEPLEEMVSAHRISIYRTVPADV